MPRKPVPWVAGADSHGDMRCPSTLAAFFEFIDYFKPQIRIGMGDHFDFRHKREGASVEDQYASGRSDLDCGLEFLRKFKPTHICWGNHDDRVWRALKHPNQNVADDAERIIGEIEHATKSATFKKSYSVFEYLKIGDLKIIHGVANSEAALKRQAAIYDKVINGHLHTATHLTVEGLHKPKELWCVPCLCRLDMPYLKTKIGALKHCNGWAYGHKYPDGTMTVHIATKKGGRWILPTEFREFKGKP
ncbi:MAG: hypothetical protein ACK5R5_06045 [Alphaproteobacteria bacterium]|jgi:metallophosphoesterase superfamily enzyme